MGLLLDEDYARLAEIGMEFEEDEKHQYLVFLKYQLPEEQYNVNVCSVLVVIPTNYNDAGIDCLWVNPCLSRKDSKAIPNVSAHGAGENHHYKGQEYCRWSRHWNNEQNNWKPGVSNIDTILRRLRWAFDHPDADK